MIKHQKNILLFLLIIILIFLSLFFLILFKPWHKDNLSNKFHTELKEIKLQNSKLRNLHEVAGLIGSSKNDLKEEFSFEKILNENDEEFAQYYIDECVFVYFEADIVTQASTGPDGTANCFDKNFNFNRDSRLTMFGDADNEKQFSGLPGFGEYNYISKGMIIIKGGDSLWQVWFTTPMDLESYKKKFLEDDSFRINEFRYNPVYDSNGGVMPATDEI